MRRLVKSLMPVTRTGALLWAWSNRDRLAEWGSFGVRAVQDVADGNGTDDSRAELRLRTALARNPRTRNIDVGVAVKNGVAVLTGRLTPEAHAAVQDVAVGTKGIARVDDQITNVAPNRRNLLRR